MSGSDDLVNSLRDAVRLSPDNVPLRVLLSEALVGVSRYEEAEKEYTAALALSPNSENIMLGLAYVCFQGGKYSQAMVIVEDLVRKSHPVPKANLLYARLLLNEGLVQQAVTQYQLAVSLDSSLIDRSFADRLGIGADKASDVVDGRVRVGASQTAPSHESDSDLDELIERSNSKFADVGGMDAVKEQIRMKIIYPMTHSETFKAYGKKIGGGILLYGPPGCGKTLMARATAGEIDSAFMSVGLHHVLDMWIGSSERNLHDIFSQARSNSPCVLFFDEVDALAASRTDMKHSAGKHVINQFLHELDGVDTNNDGLLILAATNAPWHLDPAFRRPGRFDRIIFVPPPDAAARAAILRVLLKGKPSDNIDFEFLAKKTDKFSGADLKALVDDVVEKKIEQAMKDGVPKPITTKDLEHSLKAIKPSTAAWFATARNYALYSNEGGLYDDIITYLKLK